MKITVVGRGNVGGGLAKLWQQAGHEVNALGSEGGDASDAEVVVVAVPSSAIADALGKVAGLEGRVAIDATNAVGRGDEAFESLAHEVKSIVGGPTAKSFNLNFAALYEQIGAQRARPSNLYAADDDVASGAPASPCFVVVVGPIGLIILAQAEEGPSAVTSGSLIPRLRLPL